MLSAWVAKECNRALGRELTEVEERVHADLVRKTEVRELDACRQLKSSQLRIWTQTKDVVDTQWVLTWREAEGKTTAKAR